MVVWNSFVRKRIVCFWEEGKCEFLEVFLGGWEMVKIFVCYRCKSFMKILRFSVPGELANSSLHI